jgi:hypothetical protein
MGQLMLLPISGASTTNSTTVATANPRQPWAFANIFKSFTTAR